MNSKAAAMIRNFVLAGGIIVISVRIDVFNDECLWKKFGEDKSVFMKMFGEARSILGYMSILQADLYFHGGVGHFYEEHAHGLALASRDDERDAVEVEDDHGHPHEHNHNAFAVPSKGGILLNIVQHIYVSDHKHLLGKDEKEILPWFYFAVKMDPHNIMAYTVGGYWLADRMKDVDEGLNLLKQGLVNNPESWEINAELARVYLTKKHNYSSAKKLLIGADKLLSGVPHDRFQERYVLSLLADSAELSKDKELALNSYRRIKVLFPEDPNVERMIARLAGSEDAR